MKNSIRRRTFCYFAFGMLVIILAFSLLFIRYFYGVFKERLEMDQVNAAHRTAQSMDTLLMNIKQNAYFLCSNDTLAKVLVNEAENTAAWQHEQLSLNFGINTGTPTAPLMLSAYAALMVDPQFPLARTVKGNFTLAGITRQRLYSAMDVLDQGWYQETSARKGQIYAFWGEETAESAFFAHQLRSIRIADPRYNETVGVVVYAIPQRRLMDIFENTQITDRSIALITFQDAVFLSTDPQRTPIGTALTDTALRGLSGDGRITQIVHEGVQYVASCMAFSGDWRSIVLMPNADLQQFIKTPLPMIIGVGLLFLAASALVMSFLLSRQLVRPIINLSNVMVRVQDTRELPSCVSAPASRDEIAVLYKSYNAMVEWIAKLSEQAVAEAEKLRMSELKAMQAQINPHFIYNTLDSVSCSALLEGNDDIVTMVTSLISILKYSVNFSRTTVPLGEEIDYLRHYIRIQELRYRSGFRFVCDVPEAYFSVRVSPIILQPLVENALFHAHSQEQQLEIRLYCEVVGAQLRIHVTDNGSSGDADKLNRMLCDDGEAEDSHGIGIRNVNKRIKLLAGEENGLHYQRLANGGLDAVVKVLLVFE